MEMYMHNDENNKKKEFFFVPIFILILCCIKNYSFIDINTKWEAQKKEPQMPLDVVVRVHQCINSISLYNFFFCCADKIVPFFLSRHFFTLCAGALFPLVVMKISTLYFFFFVFILHFNNINVHLIS